MKRRYPCLEVRINKRTCGYLASFGTYQWGGKNSGYNLNIKSWEG